MLFVIIVCGLLMFAVYKYMPREPIWLKGLAYFGLSCGIFLALLNMSGLLSR